jgi:homoserine kinase
MNAATAFAPATVSNVAVGFDILGFAIEGVGDVVTVSKIERPAVLISEIVDNTGSLSEIELPSDPKQNAATAGLTKLRANLKLEFGFEVSLRKGIWIGSGMGGSAASAVGAVVAANELLPDRLSREELLKYALAGEEVASGSAHADNIAPCLFGGLALVNGIDPVRVVSIPVPEEILTVVVHPRHRVETRRARDILKTEVTLADHVRQSAHLGGFIAGCYSHDFDLIRESLRDVLIEPQRAGLVPALAEVKEAAMRNGALGASISGSGPSIFAWATSPEIASKVRDAMLQAYRNKGLLEVNSWISPVSTQGARIVA